MELVAWLIGPLTPVVAVLPWALVLAACLRRGFGWRFSWLIASLSWGVATAAISELLGLAGLLTSGAALTLWVLATVAAGLLLRAAPGGERPSGRAWRAASFLRGFAAPVDATSALPGLAAPVHPTSTLPGLAAPVHPTSFAQVRAHAGFVSIVLLAGISVYAAVTFLLAVIAQPNTWDSMTYHLPRVTHWIQNGHLGHYPTHVTRQLWMPPGAELAVLQLRLLSESDRWLNLVQWFSLVSCVVGASLLAWELGADTRGQLFAAAACVSLPMAIMQASSTQTDLVTAFWLVSFACFVVRGAAQPSWTATLGAGAALGMAVLTKGTTYLFAPPFIAWLAVSLIRTLGWTALRHLMVIGLVAASLNAGHWGRNVALFGNPVTTDGLAMTNETFGWRVVASNLIRNGALHVGTRSGSFNAAVEARVSAVHTALGIDVNDRKTTFLGTRFATPRLLYREDYDGNPLHFALILLAGATVLLRPDLRRSPALLAHLVSVLGGILLFCAVLKWQPWHSRLHTPVFVLFAPVIGMAVARWRPRWLGAVVMAATLTYSAPWLLNHTSRPLRGPNSIIATPRTTQLFTASPVLEESFRQVAGAIQAAGCDRVGLLMETGDDWEYPFWVLIPRAGRGVRIEHIEVNNASRRAQRADFEPCAVVSIFRSTPALVDFPGP